MKNLTKLLLLLLALLLPATALAHDFEVDGIYYNIINGNEATVTYRGTSSYNANSYSGDVTIPSTVTYNGTTYTVTAIGGSAFYYCSDLTSVTIGNSVNTIGNSAFSGCSGLTSVTIPNSVTIIGEGAFISCSGLTSIDIPNSVTTIAGLAFYGCSGLASITIPNSVTNIGYNPFQSCSGLTSITIESSNTVYDSRDKCNALIETASNTLIAGCLNTVIPNSVTAIGDDAFSDCSGLTNIDIPDAITYIGNYAFRGCGLTSINIPKHVIYIGEEAFSCPLQQLTWNAKNCSLNYCSIAVSNIEQVTIGDEVEIIPDGFVSGSKITSITIPNSVTTIGDYALRGCSGLTSVTIGNSVTTIGEGAFISCSALTSIDIPNSVTSIGGSAFYNTAWYNNQLDGLVYAGLVAYKYKGTMPSGTSITIKEGTVSITAYAFSDCSGLTNVTIPNSVTTIGDMAFYNTAWYNNQHDGLVYAGLVAYKYKGTMPSGTNITLMDGTLGIASSAFQGRSDLTSVTIPNTVTNIGAEAFSDCGLTSITIGNAVTIIGKAAFRRCGGLTSIDIPNSVATIGNDAFEECIGLTSVDIPNSVTTIGDWAFYGCSGLTDVYSYIIDLPKVSMNNTVFSFSPQNYSGCTLHVPYGTLSAYQADTKWSQYFGNIVEMDPVIAESIELDKTAVVVIEGETLQLNAIITPEDASNKTLNWASSNPSVATIDENGFVTGVSVGTTTITAMTTDGSNLSASCQVTVKSLSTDNCFLMPDCEVLHGESIIIPIQLNNTESIMAFQTDLYLPEGFSLLTDEDDEPIITLSGRLTSDHIIMAEHLNDGGMRILCYNTSEQIISGNEGDLFYITVNTPDDAAGDYTIYLRNSRLTNMNYNEIRIPDAGAVLTVNTFIPGDVNDSHNVNVTDIVVAAQYVLQRNPSPFIYEAADMNGDGEVTVTDIMLIARLILYPTMNAPRQAPAIVTNNDRMSGESISLQPGETRKVSILLDNEMDYAAFQLDLNLPDGLTADNFELTNRAGSHAFDVESIGNGKTRILCYSPTIEAIAGNSGALLSFDVIAFAPIAGDITVDGIEMVTTTCQPVLLDAFNIGVSTQTAVNELTTGKAIARVDYYNVAGQRVDRPESGVTLVVTTYTDGTRTTTKLIH